MSILTTTKALRGKYLKVTEYQLIASICRKSFYEFVREFWDTVVDEAPVWNWHIEYLCGEAQKIAERIFTGEAKAYDLVVNVPPGTTKSLIFSVFLPAWCWTRFSTFKFIGASYSHNLAINLSRKTRKVVRSAKYRRCFPKVKLSEEQNTKVFFENTRGGWRYSVSVNGGVMGLHAHLIVVDDPIDPEETESELELARSTRWIRGTLSTRKIDKRVTPTILVMQRLHQADPTAEFLTRKRVKHICLPAEDGPNVIPPECRKHYKNGLLDVNRLPEEVLDEAKEEGEYYYNAQFLQSPTPPGGSMFHVNQIKTAKVPDKFKALFRYWDKAGTVVRPGQKSKAAFTVGTLMGVDLDDHFWVLDVERGRWDAYRREVVIKDTAKKDGVNVRIGIEEEGGSGGKESAENTIRRLVGYRVTAEKVNKNTGDKEKRAEVFASQMNGGNVYLPEHLCVSTPQGVKWRKWAREWVEEHRYFPHSRYKDQVDSASGAFRMAYKRRIRGGPLRSRSRDNGEVASSSPLSPSPSGRSVGVARRVFGNRLSRGRSW